jgi:flagellar hook-associated protein 3 FlgL
MYYQVQNSNANNMAEKLFDVNKQISSGQKFQYSYEAPTSFSDAMRLDNELSTFDQVVKSASNGLKFSQQTDSTISSITKTMDQFKTKLIQSASAANSPDSLAALAGELRGLETQLKTLANTSINGQYIFAGSMVNQKPIDDNGKYLGNDQAMTSFLGSNIRQTYNISGANMFLGEESSVKRKITTNTEHLNQSLLHPDVMTDSTIAASNSVEQYIKSSDTIRDLMGDTDNVVNTTDAQNHFYISGTNHDGSTFKTTVDMKDGETVGDLLDKIGKAYGNTATNKIVNVSLNTNGQIEVEDNLVGSSKLDFHMVANIDPSGAVTNLDDLNKNGTKVVEFTKSEVSSYTSSVGQQRNQFQPESFSLNMDLRTQSGNLASSVTPLKDIFQSDIDHLDFSGTDADGHAVTSSFAITSTSTVQDMINEMKSAYQGLTSPDITSYITNGRINFSTVSGQSNINVVLTSMDNSAPVPQAISALASNAAISYDNAKFEKSGSHLLSNGSQILKADNSYATSNTKLVDVSGTTPINGTTLNLNGIDINGNRVNATINMAAVSAITVTDTTGTVTTYPIMDSSGQPTDGSNMTYKQLTDTINMVMSGNLPDATATANYIGNKAAYTTAYNLAITNSDAASTTSLNEKGQISFEQTNVNTTKADISLVDASSTTYPTSGVKTVGSALEFNVNSALTISDPKTEFFATIDEIIKSVEQGKYRAGTTGGDLRNTGIQNGIQMLDNLSHHISKEQSQSGIQSQSLQAAGDRTQMLILSAQSMRSSVVDTDIAQATLSLNQLQLNYQAIYSTIAKVSQLSLVNYVK